jgi:hypothetical protein
MDSWNALIRCQGGVLIRWVACCIPCAFWLKCNDSHLIVYIHVCIVDMNVLWTWSCMHLQYILPWSSIAKCRCCFPFTDFHELSLQLEADCGLSQSLGCKLWNKNAGFGSGWYGIVWKQCHVYSDIISRMVFDIFWPYSPFAGIPLYTLVYPFFQTHPYDHHKGSPIEGGAAPQLTCQSHQPSVLFFHELFHAAFSLCCKVRIWHEHLFWPGRGRLRDVKGIQAAGVFLDPTFDELGKVNYSFWVLYEDIRRYPFDQYLIMAVNFWSWTKDYSHWEILGVCQTGQSLGAFNEMAGSCWHP